MNDRVLPLHGVHNFRDYGGYAVSGGGRLRRGVLWRSAQHQDATDADLAAIDALDLADVVDLRGASERAAHPCRRGPGFAANVHVQDGETTGLAPHLAAAHGALDAGAADRALMTAYEGIPFRPGLLPMLRRYFDVLVDGRGASLVHCVAGKDRTGFAVALFHSAVGVAKDDILADYELTNVAGDAERRLAEGAALLRSRYAAADDATLRTLMAVRGAYIERALSVVAAYEGGPEAYLAEVIGVTPARRELLRARYVEPV